jgi:ribonuclease HI
MCYGWLITHDDVLIAHGHGAFAHSRDATSNVAEYLALIEGLEALDDLNWTGEPVIITGDAKCVIEQMQGNAQVNSTRIRPLYERARRLADGFHKIRWNWRPRRHNKQADALTRRAMRQVRLDQKQYQEVIRRITRRKENQRPTKKLLSLMDLRVYQAGAAGVRMLPVAGD